jgi:hypothetical protein
MKVLLGITLGFAACTLVIAFTTTSADAKGCVKGAIVGGVAGHVAHHPLIGAAAGCVIGRHEAAKRAKQERDQQNQPVNSAPAPVPAKQQ